MWWTQSKIWVDAKDLATDAQEDIRYNQEWKSGQLFRNLVDMAKVVWAFSKILMKLQAGEDGSGWASNG